MTHQTRISVTYSCMVQLGMADIRREGHWSYGWHVTVTHEKHLSEEKNINIKV